MPSKKQRMHLVRMEVVTSREIKVVFTLTFLVAGFALFQFFLLSFTRVLKLIPPDWSTEHVSGESLVATTAGAINCSALIAYALFQNVSVLPRSALNSTFANATERIVIPGTLTPQPLSQAQVNYTLRNVRLVMTFFDFGFVYNSTSEDDSVFPLIVPTDPLLIAHDSNPAPSVAELKQRMYPSSLLDGNRFGQTIFEMAVPTSGRYSYSVYIANTADLLVSCVDQVGDYNAAAFVPHSTSNLVISSVTYIITLIFALVYVTWWIIRMLDVRMEEGKGIRSAHIRRPISTWLADQRLMLMLACGIFLYQDPFYLPKATMPAANARPLQLLAVFVYSVANSIFLVFWLMLLDCIRHEAAAPDTAVGDEELGTSLLLKRSIAHARALAGTRWWWIAYFILFVVLALIWFWYYTCVVHIHLFGNGNGEYVAATSAYVAMWVVWLIGFVYKFARTSRFLHLHNSLGVRFRHLAFRFFMVQTALILIYIVVKFCLGRLNDLGITITVGDLLLGSSPYNSPSSCFLFTFYASIVMFLYMHAPEGASADQCIDTWFEAEEPASSLNFCFETAMIAFRTAAEVYFSPADHPSRKDVPTIIDLEQYKLRLVRFFTSSVQTFALIAETIEEVDAAEAQRQVEVAHTSSTAAKPKARRSSMEERGKLLHGNVAMNSYGSTAPVRRKKICIAFRGTANSENVKQDTMTTLIPLPERLGTPIDGALAVRIHEGFWCAYNELGIEIVQEVRRLTAEHGPLDIIVTGHSLGGAIATLCILELTMLQQELGAMLHMYNFGSPRVGNRMFAAYFAHTVPIAFRIVNEGDIVTTIPKFFRYKHVGLEVGINHHGNYHVDLTFLDRALSLRGSVNAHRMTSYDASFSSVIPQYIGERMHGAVGVSSQREKAELQLIDKSTKGLE